jgi:hypothetical protein
MDEQPSTKQLPGHGRALDPAEPLWRLAPTRDGDGRCVADFMLLIPGLGAQPLAVREMIGGRVREVCAGFGDRVAFADLNYAINVLWVSVAAEPGLAAQVAQAIRRQVPEARLVGGQLGAVPSPLAVAGRRGLWGRLRLAGRRLGRRLRLPSA